MNLRLLIQNKWNSVSKQYLKQLSKKEMANEFETLKVYLNSLVEKRLLRLTLKESSSVDDLSKRKSDRQWKKAKDNSTEIRENYNIFLLIELMNMDIGLNLKGVKELTPEVPTLPYKRIKVEETKEEEKEETKKKVHTFSNEFSNASFGDNKQMEKLSNKRLEAILSMYPVGEQSDSDSLDINIGKKVKLNTWGFKPNTSFANDQKRDFSNLSFLQDVRNISKTSSVGKKNYGGSINKLHSEFRNPSMDNNPVNIMQKNMSQNIFESFNPALCTRNKTRIFNYEISNAFRQESDPAYRQSVFNEGNHFQTADHYFGNTNFAQAFGGIVPSNQGILNLSKEISNPHNKYSYPSDMPPLKTENIIPEEFRQFSNKLSIPNNKPNNKGDTASFGHLSLRSGKTVSQAFNFREKSNVSEFGSK
jgi:hypothetical protein